MTAVLVLSWALRGGLDKQRVDRIVEIPKVLALFKRGLQISIADILAGMAKVPSLRWKISESALYRDPVVYAGDLGEEIGLVDQMNQRGDS